MTGIREVVLGPAYFHHRRLIERSKEWSVDDIRRYQAPRIRRLARRYGSQVTEKDDYRRDLRRYSRWDLPLLTHAVRTGGTSGQPLRFRQDTFARRQKERAYLFDIWSAAGYSPYDLRVIFRGTVADDIVHYNRRENAWVVSPTVMEHHLGDVRRWARTLPPFFLHVYPSSLLQFIDLMGEESFRRLPVRGVLAGSEAFPTGEQERFEQDFGLRIAHWYGHSEYAVLAYQCRSCRGFHFYPTYGHVEFLDPETDGLSRIVASSFNRVGTQFARYDTGDLARPAVGSCTNSFPRASAIVGRSQDLFIDRSGRKRTLLPIFGMHGAVWDQLSDIQFVQDRPGALRVRIAAQPGSNTAVVEDALERRLPMADLTFQYVPRIERSPNGKRRYLVHGTGGGATGANPEPRI